MKKGFTSIIIVNYNTRELTRDCIKAVKAHFTPLLYEIIVVDNHSADGSVEYLQQLFPFITVIANDKNHGFGTANNIGVARAIGEYIFLLNSDTIVINNVLSKFVNFYTKNGHSNPGVLGSLLLSQDNEVVHSYGDFPYPLQQFAKGKQVQRELAIHYFTRVDIIVGADMFMKKAVFELFGGFDTNIFLYEEELELQYRLQKSGYPSLLLNEKGIIHLEGKSSDSFFKRKCSFISLCYIYKKHLPWYMYLFYRIKMTVYALIFFKNPRTSWQEKVAYLKLSITGK